MASFPFQHYRWTIEHTARAEALLLKQVFKDDDLPSTTDKSLPAYEVFDVPLQDGSSICTLRIPARSPIHESSNDGLDAEPPILLLHGFGTGKSIWAPILRQLATLSKEENRVIYAIDLPGMGCSSEFDKMQHKTQLREIVSETGGRLDKDNPEYVKRLSQMAISYYVDAVHAWTVEMGITRMVMMGHSFGATLAAAFVHTHSALVEKLVMISPVGFESQLSLSAVSDEEAESLQSTPPYTIADKIVLQLWTKYHITPLSIARLVGPLLPYAVRAFVHTSEMYRWARKDKKLRKYAWIYAYAMIRHRSSAETLMPCFITGTGGAVVEESGLLSDILESGVKVVIIRGGKDWVPKLRRQEELCKLGMIVIVLDKGEHSLHLTEPERTWPLTAGSLSA